MCQPARSRKSDASRGCAARSSCHVRLFGSFVFVVAVVWGLVAVRSRCSRWSRSWLTVRFIPNDRAGVVEKLWSASGSVGNGRIIALDGEAGYQAELLRGGMHFGYWRWQYRVHTSHRW